MPINDETSKSGDTKILQIRGCFYGKIKYAMLASGRWYPKGDKLWDTISRIRQIALTVYRSPSLTDREFWRFLVCDVYTRDDESRARIEWDQGARNNFDSDVEALTIQGSMPERLHLLVRISLHQKYFVTTTEGSLALIQGLAEVGDDIFIARAAALPIVLRSTVRNGAYPTSERQSIRRFTNSSAAVTSMVLWTDSPWRRWSLRGLETQSYTWYNWNTPFRGYLSFEPSTVPP